MKKLVVNLKNVNIANKGQLLHPINLMNDFVVGNDSKITKLYKKTMKNVNTVKINFQYQQQIYIRNIVIKNRNQRKINSSINNRKNKNVSNVIKYITMKLGI